MPHKCHTNATQMPHKCHTNATKMSQLYSQMSQTCTKMSQTWPKHVPKCCSQGWSGGWIVADRSRYMHPLFYSIYIIYKSTYIAYIYLHTPTYCIYNMYSESHTPMLLPSPTICILPPLSIPMPPISLLPYYCLLHLDSRAISCSRLKKRIRSH